MKKMNCLSIQREGKTMDLYMKEREKENPMPTAKAGAQCRVPVPSPPPRHGGRRGRWGQARLVGAGEAGGGRRGWWGQARPMGAVSHRPHARARQHRTLEKPPGQIPSQQYIKLITITLTVKQNPSASAPSAQCLTLLLQR